jgi:hypothetical protein
MNYSLTAIEIHCIFVGTKPARNSVALDGDATTNLMRCKLDLSLTTSSSAETRTSNLIFSSPQFRGRERRIVVLS